MRLITVFIILISTGVQASEGRPVILTFVQFSSEKIWVYTVPQDTASSLPQWTPGEGEPPMGVSEALSIARLEYPTLELYSIRLVKKRYKDEEIWFYIFEFPTPDQTVPDQTVVLMNGVLVKGKIVGENKFHQLLQGR